MEKLMKMRIQKRLTRSALITVVLASVSAVIAAILLFVVSWQYAQVLTYNAFPQGDIGIAMKELADVRSATRGAIGYDEQNRIDQMTKLHDEAVAGLQECMPKIEETLKSAAERAQFKQLQESVDNYLKIDDEIIKLGGTLDEVKSKKAQNMAFDDLAPAYQAAEKGFEIAFGKKPLAVRRGGSIPIISTFEQVLGTKTVLMGFGLESDAIHSPNENFSLDIFRKGIEAVVEFHLEYVKK